jgi:hypothetical protein
LPLVDDNLGLLVHYLKGGNFSGAKEYMKLLQEEGISIDITQLSDREKMFTALITGYLVSNYDIKKLFEVLEFINEYHLLRGTEIKPLLTFSAREREFIWSNLQVLFGSLSESFFEFVVQTLPNELLQIIKSPSFLAQSAILLTQNEIPMTHKIRFLYEIADRYSYAEIRTWKIGTLVQYLKKFRRGRKKIEKNYYVLDITVEDFSSQFPILSFNPFQFFKEEHLIYKPLLERVRQKYECREYEYEFPIVSLAYQGDFSHSIKGLIYLAPMTGELIAICFSEVETSANVAQYQQSLLNDLIPVKIEDQFKSFMELIITNEMPETELAKLTSVKQVSHYDILNQRMFFLNLIKNIDRIHQEKS